MNSLFVRAGLLVDGKGTEPTRDSIVLVENGKISKIGKEGDFGKPESAQTIDAKHSAVMPGMFELHTHLGMPEVDDKVKFMLTTPKSLIQYYAIENGLRTLRAGFTSVRSMGWFPEYDDVALKKAVEMGFVLGPRIFASKQVITQTGGHGDLVVPYHEHIKMRFGRIADGADETRKAAREQLREGADFIKTCSSGGLGSGTSDILNYTVEELKAIADEAHHARKTCAVHALSLEGVKNALEAGFDTIEHGFGLDEEAIEMMLKKKVIYVPTVSIVSALSNSVPGTLSGIAVQAAQKQIGIQMANVRRAHEAGVMIGTGTDAIGSPMRHGENALELVLLTKAGLTNLEAIEAATRVGAVAVRKEKELGTLEENKTADMLIVDGNPVADISILTNVSKIKTVIKEGKVVSTN